MAMIYYYRNFSNEGRGTSGCARLPLQEKHYRSCWKNGRIKTRGKVLVLAIGTLVVEPLSATKMSMVTIFFKV